MMDLKIADPKGLIRESYRIDGITLGECRSIFMDWALSVPVDTETKPLLLHLLSTYGAEANHPMTGVLKAALEAPESPKRRGGRAARVSGD
jgi:hypothetical protein